MWTSTETLAMTHVKYIIRRTCVCVCVYEKHRFKSHALESLKNLPQGQLLVDL